MSFGVRKAAGRGDHTTMTRVTLGHLVKHPLETIGRVEAGDTVVITRNRRPVAELRPVPGVRQSKRPIGLCEGSFVTPDDFNAPLPDDVIALFEPR